MSGKIVNTKKTLQTLASTPLPSPSIGHILSQNATVLRGNSVNFEVVTTTGETIPVISVFENTTLSGAYSIAESLGSSGSMYFFHIDGLAFNTQYAYRVTLCNGNVCDGSGSTGSFITDR